MHYVVNGVVIPTELSALPVERSGKVVSHIISDICSSKIVNSILDYGCGKLRYSSALIQKNKNVTAVDSEEQIHRIQTLFDQRTSLLSYASGIDNLSVLSVQDLRVKNDKFDFALCTNVFSCIPFDTMIQDALDTIFLHLKVGAKAIVSVQYRNSYFLSYANRKNSFEYNGGWVIRGRNKVSYYRIIQPKQLKTFCEISGFTLCQEITKDGSVFLILQK